MYEVYETEDGILPLLNLADPCEVRIEVKDDTVSLQVGTRDWQWSRKTGVLVGSGTDLSSGSVPFDPENPQSQHTSE